jgi:hypothetical protein
MDDIYIFYSSDLSFYVSKGTYSTDLSKLLLFLKVVYNNPPEFRLKQLGKNTEAYWKKGYKE